MSCFKFGGGDELSYVLFRLHQPQESDDDRKQGAELLELLKDSLPELNGQLFDAAKVPSDVESGIILQVPQSERFETAHRVRTVLREKGFGIRRGGFEQSTSREEYALQAGRR